MSGDYDPVQIALMKEECIRVNEQDSIIGSISKKQAHLMENIRKKQALHRAFSVFYFVRCGDEFKLLLQQRSSEKITFPDYWTNTCCSHPLHEIDGERDGVQGVKAAAVRKMEHELGITAQSPVPLAKLHFLTRILYEAPSDGTIWGEAEVDYILISVRDGQNVSQELQRQQVNKNEVRDVKYFNQEELRTLLQDQCVKITPWFKLICESFIFKWWDALEANEEDPENVLRAMTEPNKIHNMIKQTLIQCQFAVDFKSDADTQAVKQALDGFGDQVKLFSIDFGGQTVIVLCSCSSLSVFQALVSTGLPVVYRSVGPPNGNSLGAAVCILDHKIEKSGIKSQVSAGLVRLVQIDQDTCWVDVSLSVNFNYLLGVFESGDFSQYSGHGSLLFTIQEGSKNNIVLPQVQLKLSDLVGRSICVIPKNDENFIIGGVIARSAGLFENQKVVCSCTGKTMFEEAGQ